MICRFGVTKFDIRFPCILLEEERAKKRGEEIFEEKNLTFFEIISAKF